MSQPPRPPPTRSNSVDRRLPIYPEARIPPNKRPNLPERSTNFSSQSRPAASMSRPMTLRSVSSPPPLPHLLRIRDLDTGFDLSDDPQKIISVNRETPNEPELNSPASASHDNIPSTSLESPLPDAASQVQLRRKRSCIKRSSTDFAKTVSWADDRDLAAQVSKYASVAREAQSSG